VNRTSPLALSAVLLAGVTVSVPTARAATVEIFPSNADASCNEELEARANALQPGDVLILHGGVYTQTCRCAITANGTPANPITIRAADGETPIVTRPVPANFRYDQNNVEIVNSSYLVIKGLRFKGGDGGVSFIGGHHITFEDNEVYETGNNHHTGLPASAAGTTEGEGLYVGCNNAACVASNHLIEGNYIHHTRATSDGGNDGIEIKVGSHSNIVRNNVIHDTTDGRQYPCIFVYGGGPGPNVVEGNAMWNCGEAIQVVSDAVVRNNLVLNSMTGITAAPHAQVAQLRNVTIVNNTIYGHSTCVFVRWSGASNMILANNAFYCPGGAAVNGSGLTGSGLTISSNYFEGASSGTAADGARFVGGGTAASGLRRAGPARFLASRWLRS
jgi:Right handed beta helix region